MDNFWDGFEKQALSKSLLLDASELAKRQAAKARMNIPAGTKRFKPPKELVDKTTKLYKKRKKQSLAFKMKALQKDAQ